MIVYRLQLCKETHHQIERSRMMKRRQMCMLLITGLFSYSSLAEKEYGKLGVEVK